MARHYLDHASTSPPRPEVVAAMTEWLSRPGGDPGRIHAEGLEARVAVETRPGGGRRPASAPARGRSCSRAAPPRPIAVGLLGSGGARRPPGAGRRRALGGAPGGRGAWRRHRRRRRRHRARRSRRAARRDPAGHVARPRAVGQPRGRHASSPSPRSWPRAATAACSSTSTPPPAAGHDADRLRRARRRPAVGVRPQARGPGRHRRAAGATRPAHPPAAARRRSGAGPPSRPRAGGGDRRLRRRGRDAVEPSLDREAAEQQRLTDRLPRRHGHDGRDHALRPPRPIGSPTSSASASTASSRRPCSSASTAPASPPTPARRARRSRSSRRRCSRPWASTPTTASASRSAGPPPTPTSTPPSTALPKILEDLRAWLTAAACGPQVHVLTPRPRAPACIARRTPRHAACGSQVHVTVPRDHRPRQLGQSPETQSMWPKSSWRRFWCSRGRGGPLMAATFSARWSTEPVPVSTTWQPGSWRAKR